MIPLIDADVLVYEVGFGCETGWEGEDPPPFDRAAELLDNRIQAICYAVGATAPPALYLTGKGNFREKIAVSKPYKGNRLQEKPFHYKNLRAYMVGKWNAIIVEGIEADDAMAIEQCRVSKENDGCAFALYNETPTIICTRDKDLRQVSGLHYGWELGNQPSFGPKFISEEEGMRFFYKQCLMGDKTDNIEGIPKCGPVKADKILGDTKISTEMFEAVREAYRAFYGQELGDERLLEMGRLLWMTRELDDEGKPKMWEFPRMDEQQV